MLSILDEVIRRHKAGEGGGIASICSAHPWVLKAALQIGGTVLVESTCNQVNQFGGYTGLTPRDFRAYLHRLAAENNYPAEQLVLGGDHLGPSPWQSEPASSAMPKAQELVRACVQAGYTKIHLDASMRLGDDDPSQSLDLELIARRTAQLALAAYTALPEASPASSLRYVIGSEVPIPGGALEHEEGVRVTEVKDVQQMLDATRQGFFDQGLEAAWEQVIAAVVQPGVEFGDDFILKYEPEASHELSHYIESTPYIYEAHSTDYQPQDCLRELVRDHFAILKVGPALTYAFREAVFALAQVEDQLVPASERSRLVEVLDEVMLKKPEYWVKHYHGTEQELAHARKYSLSDRIRYYWAEPEVQAGFDRLLANLGHKHLPRELIEQYLPMTASIIQQRKLDYLAQVILIESVSTILRQYRQACEPLQY